MAAGALALAGAAALAASPLHDPREHHLADLRQLTEGADVSSIAWAPSGDRLIYASSRPLRRCEQIFDLSPSAAGAPRRLSSGKGRATGPRFLGREGRMLWASTEAESDRCPPPPDFTRGAVRAIDAASELYTTASDGRERTRLTDNGVYDGEATVCPATGAVVFTSARDGDLELYRMNADGSSLRRLTRSPGYDGGAAFSPDCTRIVWHAARPRGAELDADRELLRLGLVRPSQLEIWAADADGANARQVTDLGAASSTPVFFPDGERILFSSSFGDPRGRELDLWAIDADGSRLERITWATRLDGAPAFSPDGTQLAFASKRSRKRGGETDLFVARWIEGERTPTVVRGADRIAADVAWLADDAREGRGLGSDGLAAAGAWIEERFAAIGLAPAGENGFRQEFRVEVARRPGSASASSAEPAPGSWPLFNVVGRLDPAAAPIDDRVIVLGAHYDHLGRGGFGSTSLEPGSRELHNGADDNASGVAALLEAARILVTRRGELRRAIVFAAFTGEEHGLVGSNRLVRRPPPGLAMAKVEAMINLDMVGRLRHQTLTVGGVETAAEWSADLEVVCGALRLVCTPSPNSNGPSDHMSFAVVGIPVLFLFTGNHDQYHRPTDDAPLVNATGGARVAALVADLALRSAERGRTPSYGTHSPMSPVSKSSANSAE